MSNSLELKKKEDFDFKYLFKSLNDTFSPAIENVVNTYWQENFGVKLYFLGEDLKFFAYGTKFFVTQAQIQKIICDMRLSAELCEMLLDNSLGKKTGVFKINEITNLEGEILAKFSKILFDKFQSILPSKEELKEMIAENIDFEEKIHLGFVIFSDDANYEAGKFILTVPKNLLQKIEPIAIQEDNIDVSCFTKAKGEIDILVGKTKLSLDDMRQLDIEDIVLLENSNIKIMKIVYPELLNINVNPDPRLFINEEQDGDVGEAAMEDIMDSVENIWDNVQVDVLAKFSKVKLSLGELRQMSEGAVVELDHVYDNKVVLEVEKKTVAKGELVIIGDKYGVRITETYANPTEAEEYLDEEDDYDEEFEENDDEENEASDDFDVNDFEIDGKE